MGSDQVGQILRQSGPNIKLIVARPVPDLTSDLQVIQNNHSIVPTRILNDPTELEKQIQCLQQQVSAGNLWRIDEYFTVDLKLIIPLRVPVSTVVYCRVVSYYRIPARFKCQLCSTFGKLVHNCIPVVVIPIVTCFAFPYLAAAFTRL